MGTLNTLSLLVKERRAYTFPTINKSLLSAPETCDEGDEARFMQKKVHVTCEGKLILKGKRDPNAGIWLVTIGSSSHSKNFIRTLPNAGKHSSSGN